MSDSDPLVVLIPVYEDWEPLRVLLPQLDAELDRAGLAARVVIVDDGSPTPAPDGLFDGPGAAIAEVAVLRLRRNLGHQRALAIGIAYLEANVPCRAVVVMDGDGEDAPDVVPRLVARMGELDDSRIVFAARTRRSESLVFRLFYLVFRLVHYSLTGLGVRVGNFSVIPRSLLGRLVVSSDMWNHYAASVHKARIPHDSIPSSRAPRLGGRSHMNFVSLVTHGLCAMAVFGDRIGVRLLIATMVMVAAAVISAVAIFLSYSAGGDSMPAGVIYGLGLLAVLTLQTMLFSFLFVFLILIGRNASDFLPARDHGHFIDGHQLVYPKP